ncbi:hypothetical protein D3C73_1336900 [compost metagenome]
MIQRLVHILEKIKQNLNRRCCIRYDKIYSTISIICWMMIDIYNLYIITKESIALAYSFKICAIYANYIFVLVLERSFR